MRTPLPPPAWLAQANRLALLGERVAKAIHEVNNGLQVISGQVDMLESAAGGSEVVQVRSRRIGTNARNCSAVLVDLLAFTKGLAERTGPVALAQVAHLAMRGRRDSLNLLDIDAVVETSEAGEASVIGNPRAILQIVLNIILYTEQALAGWPAATVRLRTRQLDGAAELVVEDNGPGMPEDTLSRASGTVSELDDLTIGLRAAQWLAERQGGRLHWTQSEGGTGCRATLWLPGP